MSLKQVNSLAISVADYLCFDHIARYQFYLQMIGNQQKSVFWRTLDIADNVEIEDVTFKALNPASFFQRILSSVENGFIFDTSTCVTSVYKKNSVVLCLDFSCSMRELDYATGNTYTESLLLNLPHILSSLFQPWSEGSGDLDLSTDFKLRFTNKSIHLTVLAFGEHFANCLLFDHEVTAATA
ncbi:hypothetical protein WA538_002415, partial [Blastocystis sp. DL]